MIVETEGYLGARDLASHARFGPTRRGQVLFGPPGRAYVYFVYGMHNMFNVVVEPEGRAGAVLVRALEPVEGLDLMSSRRPEAGPRELCRGPGRLCRALGITLDHNGLDLAEGPLAICKGSPLADVRVEATPRIGVSGSAEEPYRFLVKDNPYVSGSRTGRSDR